MNEEQIDIEIVEVSDTIQVKESGQEKKTGSKNLLNINFDKFFVYIFCNNIKDSDKGQIYRYLLALVLILVGYLQQISLLIFDNVEFGLWGDIFGNIKFLSLNVDFGINQVTGDISLLIAAYMFPFCLAFWYVFADEESWDRGIRRPWFLKVTVFIVLLIFFLSSLSAFFISAGVGLAMSTPGVILLIVLFGWFLRKKFLSFFFEKDIFEGSKLKEDFHKSEMKYVDIFLTISLPSVASVWINVGLLNENDLVRIIGGITGGLVILFLLVRKFIEVYDESLYNRYVKKISWVTHGLFLNPYSNAADNFSANRITNIAWYVPIMIFVEKILLAGIPNLADFFDNGDGNIIKIGNFIALVVIFLTFLNNLIVKVYRDRILRVADNFSRFSNVLIMTFAVLNTEFQEEKFSENFELYASISMILISFYMLVFWLRVLDLKEFVLWLYFDFTGIFRSIYARYRWQYVKTAEQAQNIILSRKLQEVSEIEWEVLSYHKRVCSICVERSRTLTAEELEECEVNSYEDIEATSVLKLGFKKLHVSDISVEALRKYGMLHTFNIKALLLVELGDVISDYKVVVESGAIEKLLKNGVTKYGIDGRNISTEDLRYFLISLERLQFVTEVKLVDIELENEHMEVVLEYLDNFGALESLMLNSCGIRNSMAKGLVPKVPCEFKKS